MPRELNISVFQAQEVRHDPGAFTTVGNLFCRPITTG